MGEITKIKGSEKVVHHVGNNGKQDGGLKKLVFDIMMDIVAE